MPPRRSLRVLHTADVHLDGDVGGTLEQQAAYRERGRRVLQRIVDRALDDEVDLLLIAGDLFDHNRVPDATIAFVRGELDRLRQPVVILPGNHDALYSKSIYDRHDFSAGAPHVHVIRQRDGETLDFPELQVSVWGRAMEEHVPTFQPLGNIPRPDDRRWSIAMGHGFFYPERQRPDRSSPIFAEEICDAGWDYFALGHHHLRTDVSQGRVAAHYPGAPLEGGSGHADGALLCIDFSADDGIRVSPRRLD